MPSSSHGLRRALCGAAFPALIFTLTSGACAAAPGWSWEVSQAFSRDTNLFRLPDGASPVPGASRADTLSTTALDLSLEQSFGRQRLRASAGLEALRYRHHDELNHDAHHADVRLDWETVGRWSGQLRGASTRSLRPLDAAASSAPRNLETTDEAAALVRLGGAAQLAIEGQLGGRGVSYSDPAFDAAELRADSAWLGLRWRPGGASQLGTAWRETRGRYVNSSLAGDRYRSRAWDFWGTWTPSPAQRLYLRASPLHARYDLREERNFSGLTGALAWQWTPRGSWRVTARAVRDLGQDAYLERYGLDDAAAQALPAGHVDTGVVLTRLGLAADRALTAKVQAAISLGWTRRTLGSAVPGSAPAVLRTAHDTTSQAAAGLRWEPRRATQLGCDVAVEHRNADGLLSTPYTARVYGCFGRLSW